MQKIIKFNARKRNGKSFHQWLGSRCRIAGTMLTTLQQCDNLTNVHKENNNNLTNVHKENKFLVHV
jgi:hypothetical protein